MAIPHPSALVPAPPSGATTEALLRESEAAWKAYADACIAFQQNRNAATAADLAHSYGRFIGFFLAMEQR